MYIFTTIDNNFPEIWEKSGIATFSSRFEGAIYKDIEGNLGNGLYAIGIYRGHKNNPQSLAPSLLSITGVSLISGTEHDIRIVFTFLKKMPLATDAQLCELKKSPFPLIRKVDAESLLRVACQPHSLEKVENMRAEKIIFYK